MKAAAILAVTFVSACAPAPAKILFDTDLQTDCDDAGAFAVLHALADLGEAEILGVGICTAHPWAAPCADAINTWYGRPGLPIGQVMKGGPLLASKFTRGVAESCPHDLKSGEQAPDVLDVYRRILEAQPDGSVVFVTAGYKTNAANFLKLGPDAVELLRRKVKVWVCMAGNFPQGTGDNVNFTRDPASASYAVRNWPGPIVYCGREIGHAMQAGARLAGTPPENPVRKSYELYFNGAAKNRHCADLAAVLYAVRGLGDFWDLRRGRMEIRDDATFQWKDSAEGRDAHLLWKTPPERVRAVLEELMLRPPALR